MGSKYEVTIWVNEYPHGWHQKQTWKGENLIFALYHLYKAKLTGTSLATLKCR